MPELLLITPVKDSIDTALDTIDSVLAFQTPRHCERSEAISQNLNKVPNLIKVEPVPSPVKVDFTYIIYNDFSAPTAKTALIEKQTAGGGFELINMEDITDTPSPNYRLVLIDAQKKALEMGVPLVILESDVTVQPDTLGKLLAFSRKHPDCGMAGAVTVDESGAVNFPYLNHRNEALPVIETSHSLSFCCTLLTPALLNTVAFSALAADKDWYDVHISRLSRHAGFKNYLLMDTPVLHRPHSSRPWKRLKYSNPLKYYFLKFFHRKDRI